MPVVINALPIRPRSTLKSSLLLIPPINAQQVVKYICDFSISNGGFLISYILNPASIQLFGCARMMRVDARNLLLPVTLFLADSLSDSITIMPGDYDTFHLDGSSSDTYTVTGFDATDSGQSGYLNIYIYNYLDLDMMKKRAGHSYQISALCTVSSFPLLSILPPPIGGGMPIIESIDVFTDFAASGGNTFLNLTPNIFANQAWVGPNPWRFYYNGTMLVYSIKPNCILPPLNAAVIPANDNLSEVYSWQLTPSATGTLTTGAATFLVKYRFN